MSRFELRVDWLAAPADDEAFGPERSTWASLRILIDGEVVTTNHSADVPTADEAAVVGPMSGLADWIVDSWVPVHRETHTPFPKVLSPRQGLPQRFPSLRDAASGWPGFVQDEAVSGDDLGAWQQRHTLGAAASDLALPSMVMVPEDAWMGIGLDHIPASLSPGVRFTPPGSPDSWPASPIWVPLADVSESLHAFVDATIRRATETGAETWAAWTQERWRSARARADAPEEVRKWMYGEFVAERWNEIEQRLGRKADVLSNILIDSALVEDVSALDWLVGLLSSTTHAPAPAEGDGKARAPRIDWSLPPFREGYRLAQHARKELGLDDRPLNAKLVQEVLRHYGIEGREVRAHNLFRSAVWQSEGSAMLVWAVDDPRFSGQQPQRFSIAAALGRLLANGGSSNLGAAHSNQSRWRPTQLANAFAAEFLLPVQAIRQAGADVEKLSRRFGMSRSATAWHIVNRSEPEND